MDTSASIRMIEDELRHLANDDIHIRAVLQSIRYGTPPLVALCQAIVAMSGGLEAQRKTITQMMRESTRPITVPEFEFAKEVKR